MKRILLVLLLFAGSLNAQNSADFNKSDSSKFNHYIGIQANNLLRQLFSFGNSAQPASNPFLLNYSLIQRTNGIGFHVGAGYDFINFAENDGVTDRKTYANNVAARLGLEKLKTLAPKWQAGIGFEGVFRLEDNKTETTVTNFETIKTLNHLSKSEFGGGLRALVRFAINQHIWLGTEASLYFISGKNKTKSEITQVSQISGEITSVTQNEFTTSSVGLSVPAVVYLTLRF